MNYKVEKFLEQELTHLKDILILKNDKNHYFLFGNYEIKPHQNLFKVELNDVYRTEVFNFLPCAITWCLYHYNKKHNSLKRIQQLDGLLSSLDLSIKIHNRMISNNKNSQDLVILETKLREEILKKEALQKELDTLMSKSKNWQSKKFKEKIT